MEVINKENRDMVRFCDLKPGDCFLDDGDDDIEMKLDPSKQMVAARCDTSDGQINEGDGLSVRLHDGAVWFYSADHLVQPVKVKAVEE